MDLQDSKLLDFHPACWATLELNMAEADVVGVAPYGEPLESVRVQFRGQSKNIDPLQKLSLNILH